MAYLHGLLGPVERKNGWQLTEAIGDTTPDGVQALLSRVHGMRTRCAITSRGYAVAHLDDPDAILALDESGFLRRLVAGFQPGQPDGT